MRLPAPRCALATFPGPAALLTLALLALGAAGCGDAPRLAARYRAEQALARARMAEEEHRLGARRDTSASLAVWREFARVRREVPPPYVTGTSDRERRIGREALRVVAAAELQGAAHAIEANRPDLALAQAEWLKAHAAGDTTVLRQADFLAAGALRQMGRLDDAVARMRRMLADYPPQTGRAGEEDAILAVPEQMVSLRRDHGDRAGAARELEGAITYFQGLLATPRRPSLEAQIRARLVRVHLERGDASDALGQLERLDRLVAANPGLRSLDPEIRYSRAKIEAAAGGNPSRGIAMLERMAADYPTHPLAARALFDAAVFLENRREFAPALERYRTLVELYPRHDTAPIALFRQAMLEEQSGDWDRAKATLESIPVKYPRSQAAAEAPITIAMRYYARGDQRSGRTAVARAIQTYEEMIARDSSSAYTPLYRWNVLRGRLALGEWEKALATVDAMALRHRGHPYAGQALLEGARVAAANRQKERAAGFLQRYLDDYPESPLAADVRREKDRLLR